MWPKPFPASPHDTWCPCLGCRAPALRPPHVARSPGSLSPCTPSPRDFSRAPSPPQEPCFCVRSHLQVSGVRSQAGLREDTGFPGSPMRPCSVGLGMNPGCWGVQVQGGGYSREREIPGTSRVRGSGCQPRSSSWCSSLLQGLASW